MELFLQRIFDGLSNGAVYAALALAVVLVHRTSRVLNLAQGEMAMFSTFIVYVLWAEAGLAPGVAIVLGVALAGFGGAAIFWVVVRPATRRSPLGLYVVPIALFIGLNSLAVGIWKGDPRTIASPFPSDLDDFMVVGGARLRFETIGVWMTLAVALGIVFWLLERTRLGLSLRAVASNPESSRFAGLFPERVAMVGWGLAAAIGCLAGVMAATTSLVQPNMMLGTAIYAFAAATLGGIDSPIGAVVGGVVVGLVTSVLAGYVKLLADLDLVTALLVMTLVLVLKPDGLFGRSAEVRV